jgi:hypothetical protein
MCQINWGTIPGTPTESAGQVMESATRTVLRNSIKMVAFFTPEGKLSLTPQERAEQLAEKLRAVGIDPDSV